MIKAYRLSFWCLIIFIPAIVLGADREESTTGTYYDAGEYTEYYDDQSSDDETLYDQKKPAHPPQKNSYPSSLYNFIKKHNPLLNPAQSAKYIIGTAAFGILGYYCNDSLFRTNQPSPSLSSTLPTSTPSLITAQTANLNNFDGISYNNNELPTPRMPIVNNAKHQSTSKLFINKPLTLDYALDDAPAVSFSASSLKDKNKDKKNKNCDKKFNDLGPTGLNKWSNMCNQFEEDYNYISGHANKQTKNTIDTITAPRSLNDKKPTNRELRSSIRKKRDTTAKADIESIKIQAVESHPTNGSSPGFFIGLECLCTDSCIASDQLSKNSIGTQVNLDEKQMQEKPMCDTFCLGDTHNPRCTDARKVIADVFTAEDMKEGECELSTDQLLKHDTLTCLARHTTTKCEKLKKLIRTSPRKITASQYKMCTLCDAAKDDKKRCNLKLFHQGVTCGSGKQQNYRGHVNNTITGKSCQYWPTEDPHYPSSEISVYPHSYDPVSKTNTGNNYCRNPNNDPKGAWCYTREIETPREYCSVASCTRETPDPLPTAELEKKQKLEVIDLSKRTFTDPGLYVSMDYQAPHYFNDTKKMRGELSCQLKYDDVVDYSGGLTQWPHQYDDVVDYSGGLIQWPHRIKDLRFNRSQNPGSKTKEEGAIAGQNGTPSDSKTEKEVKFVPAYATGDAILGTTQDKSDLKFFVPESLYPFIKTLATIDTMTNEYWCGIDRILNIRDYNRRAGYVWEGIPHLIQSDGIIARNMLPYDGPPLIPRSVKHDAQVLLALESIEIEQTVVELGAKMRRQIGICTAMIEEATDSPLHPKWSLLFYNNDNNINDKIISEIRQNAILADYIGTALLTSHGLLDISSVDIGDDLGIELDFKQGTWVGIYETLTDDFIKKLDISRLMAAITRYLDNILTMDPKEVGSTIRQIMNERRVRAGVPLLREVTEPVQPAFVSEESFDIATKWLALKDLYAYASAAFDLVKDKNPPDIYKNYRSCDADYCNRTTPEANATCDNDGCRASTYPGLYREPDDREAILKSAFSPNYYEWFKGKGFGNVGYTAVRTFVFAAQMKKGLDTYEWKDFSKKYAELIASYRYEPDSNGNPKLTPSMVLKEIEGHINLRHMTILESYNDSNAHALIKRVLKSKTPTATHEQPKIPKLITAEELTDLQEKIIPLSEKQKLRKERNELMKQNAEIRDQIVRDRQSMRTEPKRKKYFKGLINTSKQAILANKEIMTSLAERIDAIKERDRAEKGKNKRRRQRTKHKQAKVIIITNSNSLRKKSQLKTTKILTPKKHSELNDKNR